MTKPSRFYSARGVREVGDTEKIEGIRRLDKFVRAVERQVQPEANFDAVMRTKTRYRKPERPYGLR
jgi:hypothetical protein